MPHSREYNREGALTYIRPNINPLKNLDDSYFFFGLSLSQVGFQSGTLSSPNNNINFQFNANIDNIVGMEGQKKQFTVPIVAMFMLDGEIIIQVVPNSDQPIVRVSTKSVVGQ